MIPRDITADTRPRLESHTTVAARLRRIDLMIIDEVSMLHQNVLAYADRQLRDLWPRDHPRRDQPFGGVVVLLTGNWAQLKPVVPRGDDTATREASIKMSALYAAHFHEFTLRENMRVLPGEREHAEWLDQLGRGQNYHNVPNRTVLIPEQCRCTSADELINFAFPPHLFTDPIANVEELRRGAVLCPHRETVGRMNQGLMELIPGEWLTMDGFDHLTRVGNRPGPWDVNVADVEIENIHARQPSGFPPYRLRLKVGSICVMLTNYDPMAGLFNGTRVQVLTLLGDNLLRVRILDGRSRHVGQTRLIGRARFEYGRATGERDIPFTRQQFPIDPAFLMSYTKAQGQSLPRCGLWNWDSQPFADGMLYTGCSRSTSAAGLKIFSSLGNLTMNKVDFQLLGVRPRAVQAPPPPAPEPVGEQPPMAPATPDLGGLRILSRAPTRPVTPVVEPMIEETPPPTPTVHMDTSVPPPTPTVPMDTSVPPPTPTVPMDTLPPVTPRPTAEHGGEMGTGNRFFGDSTPLIELAAPPLTSVEDESAAPAPTEQQDGETEATTQTPPPPPQQPPRRDPRNPPAGGEGVTWFRP
jgi:hypothetical protein